MSKSVKYKLSWNIRFSYSIYRRFKSEDFLIEIYWQARREILDE